MQFVWWTLAAVGAFIAWYIAGTMYLAYVLRWEDNQTIGLNYYGRSPAERAAFKRKLRLHARLLQPLLALNSKMARVDFRRARFTHEGISGPAGSCSADSFKRGAEYEARPEDIFVVTQMKCGTTWMQHVVYQVLHRGAGDLVERGATMYATSPWLEGRKSVSLEDAPLVSAHCRRIIKTHFPAQLCPQSPAAKYIYVARHPVSCFASCIDFVETNVGAMAPELPAYEAWFTSPELMWWGTWADHVKGWWERAQQQDNVLFVYFEEMKRDLPAIAQKVAAFLELPPLSDTELAHVVEKCSFAYMQKHQDNFEMQPPHILQTNAALFVSGKADRHHDVPAEVSARIRSWAAAALPPGHAITDVYVDLVSTTPTAVAR
ncbi:MAG TPA: sulfotransferase domain-containing protein [Longimicrobiales bacterium]